MYKPSFDGVGGRSDLISNFGGYTNKTVIPENCFVYQKNMSLRKYPALSPRVKRAFSKSAKGRFYGIHSKEKLCYILDGYLYIGNKKIEEPYFGNSTAERILVSMGSKLIIFPDKMYINTQNTHEYGYLEWQFSSSGARCSLCAADGTEYTDYKTSDKEPANPENGDLWLDISGDEYVMKQYSESLGSWLEVGGTRVKISCPGIDGDFKKYDCVTIEGLESAGISGDYIIRDLYPGAIIVTASISGSKKIDGEFTVTRSVPDMDFVCESNNRLWGCSSENNQIYASRQGDPSNFYAYEGISTDSFTATVGTDGQFTGCIPYRGYVMFFKENCVHKVYGQTTPYSITTSYIRGVEKTSSKSLVCMNETLYYKSPTGVCSYEGGVPVEIGKDLGQGKFLYAVGGAAGSKYYLSMCDAKGRRSLFCYDEEPAMWTREDDIEITDFALNNSNLYFVQKEDDNFRLGLIDSVNVYGDFSDSLDGFSVEEDFEWQVKTGLWGLDLPQSKYYNSFTIRAVAEKGASFKIYYDTDSRGEFKLCTTRNIDKAGSFNVKINSPRCDHIQFLFEGKGEVTVFSIMREIGVGSDAYV